MFTPTAEKLVPDLTPREELVVLAAPVAGGLQRPPGRAHHRQPGRRHPAVQPVAVTWAELRPSQVLRIDLDGRVLEGRLARPAGHPPPPRAAQAARRRRVGGAQPSALRHRVADLAEVPPILDQSSALGGGTLALVDEYEGPVNDAERPAGGGADGRRRHGAPRRARRLRPGRLGPRRAPARGRAGAAVPARLVRRVAGGRCLTVPQSFIDLVARSDGEGFLGFWEAAVRAELAARPTCSTEWGQETSAPGHTGMAVITGGIRASSLMRQNDAFTWYMESNPNCA